MVMFRFSLKRTYGQLPPWKRHFILGIESSCDDTGAAVLNSKGELLGESLVSQTSSRFGGVIPSLAMGRHARSLPGVVEKAMGDTPFSSLKAIAISNRPGLQGSLAMGTDYAKYLSLKHGIPLIPIHHMEAHALTPRFIYPELTFPYLFLLISGGNCILGVASKMDDFHILGHSSNSPGEALDKVARALRLHTRYPSLQEVSGGQCVETLALDGDPTAFTFNPPLVHQRNCQFSFTGMKAKGLLLAETATSSHKETADLCASFQFAIGRHICMRLQRAFEYMESGEQLTQRKLVVSGGVACNKALRTYIDKVAAVYNYDTYYPPPRYCTDNGLMIAWNGYEKLCGGFTGIPPSEVLSIQTIPRARFGTNIAERVEEKQIKCKWIKILE